MEEYILKEEPKITVADVQKVLLYMIEEIDKVCLKNGIDYWLNGGSALGAMRHKGFIPWDDDLDIAISQKQYTQFLSALEKDLPDNFYFQCFENDSSYNVLIPTMKIRLKDTYIKEANYLLRNKCKSGDGLFIDVFVYHNFSGNIQKDYRYRLWYYLMTPAMVILDNLGINPKTLKSKYIKRLEKYDKINKGSKFIGFDWVWRSIKVPFIFEEETIFPTKRIKFEDLNLPVANKTEKFLDLAIAKSWRELPKESTRAPKHIVEIDLGEYLWSQEKN